MSEELDYRVLRRVGEIVRKVLKLAMNKVHEGMPVIELCELLESEIRSLGAEPAFPVNISINNVAAHYTSPIGDTSTIPKGAVVKIDVGAHIDGNIVDAAVTVSFSDKYTHLVEASARALERAIEVLKAGTRLSSVGAAIEETIRMYGYTPVSDLTGHLIRRYRLHAGKSVPNVRDLSFSKAQEGEVYAVEPFATDGIGRTKAGKEAYIHSIMYNRKKLKKVSDEARKVVESIYNERRELPFAERWLTKILQTTDRSKVLQVIKTLQKNKLLYSYPVLYEASKGIVSQTEDTVIVRKDHAEPLVNTVELVL